MPLDHISDRYRVLINKEYCLIHTADGALWNPETVD